MTSDASAHCVYETGIPKLVKVTLDTSVDSANSNQSIATEATELTLLADAVELIENDPTNHVVVDPPMSINHLQDNATEGTIRFIEEEYYDPELVGAWEQRQKREPEEDARISNLNESVTSPCYGFPPQVAIKQETSQPSVDCSNKKAHSASSTTTSKLFTSEEKESFSQWAKVAATQDKFNKFSMERQNRDKIKNTEMKVDEPERLIVDLTVRMDKDAIVPDQITSSSDVQITFNNQEMEPSNKRRQIPNSLVDLFLKKFFYDDWILLPLRF
jgi:hypothetical protein